MKTYTKLSTSGFLFATLLLLGLTAVPAGAEELGACIRPLGWMRLVAAPEDCRTFETYVTWGAEAPDRTADLCALYQNLFDASMISPLQVPTYCAAPTNIVFVTSTTYDGNLGGLAGADAKCMERAAAADLPGTFKAWLSDSTADPSVRFTRSTGPYVLTDGTVVAANWTALITGPLQSGILLTENAVESLNNRVQTGTNSEGLRDPRGEDPQFCDDWTSSAPHPQTRTTGNTFDTNDQWSVDGSSICSNPTPLYCFQQ